jgi:light-regulated signal transduction histidine kinase (bacteriophytochrome)
VKDATDRITREYTTALEQYLVTADETALAHAYELGRVALGEGLGLLEVVALHHEALRHVNQQGAFAASFLSRAAQFFGESVSPFEMAQRGYREANARLQELNRDIEARNAKLLRAKEIAEAASNELEAFSYSVSHDLRAPLRSIDGFSQALLEDCADRLDSDGKRYLKRVRESAQQMGELIDDLLNLAHVTRGELRREPVNLSELARSVLGRLRESQPERAVEVVVQDGLTARADSRLLDIALTNLLGNAWKFTGKRASARIEFAAKAGEHPPIYFVRDNGAGFDAAYAGKLFGVFQRLHAAHEFEGTGIGLATVQRIVGRHGGRIWAEGAVDRGATFYFTLGEGHT